MKALIKSFPVVTSNSLIKPNYCLTNQNFLLMLHKNMKEKLFFLDLKKLEKNVDRILNDHDDDHHHMQLGSMKKEKPGIAKNTK